MKGPYLVLRQGTTFTPFGATPDTVLSSHKTEAAARKAFDRIEGPALLVAPDGSKLESKLA